MTSSTSCTSCAQAQQLNAPETRTSHPLSNPVLLAVLASVSCILWGSALPVIRLGYEILSISSSDTGSLLLFAGTRFFLAGLAVTLVHALVNPAARRLPNREELGLAVELSFFQTFGQYLCTYIGTAHATGVSSSLLQGVSVFVAVIVSALIFHMERFTARKALGCIVGFAGVALSAGDIASAGFSLEGEGMIVLATVMAAMSTVLMARHSQGHSPVLLCGWQFMIGGIGLAAVGLVLGGHVAFFEHPAGLIVLAWLVMVSAVAYGVWSMLLRDNDVSRVAIFEFEIPVFGVLLSLVLLGPEGTTVGLATVGSLILVAAGIYIVERSPLEKHSTQTDAPQNQTSDSSS